MSDIRVCKFCDRQFDIDNLSSSVRIIDPDETHFTFIENGGYGACHVMSKSQAAEKIEPADEVKYEVRQPEPKAAPEPAADILQKLFQEAEPIEEPVEVVADPPSEQESAIETEVPLSVEPDLEIVFGDEIDARVNEVPRRAGGYGFAAIDGHRRTSPSFVWFDADVETVGTIHIGSLIRAVIGEPDEGFTIPRLRKIRIYQDVEEQE